MKLEMTWTRNDHSAAGFIASWRVKPESLRAPQADDVRADAMGLTAAADLAQPEFRPPEAIAIAA
jgi:hypothetical protein